MKILVTGGAGFIGSHIAENYLQAGHTVVIVDNLSTGHKENIPAGVHFYTASVESSDIFQVLADEKPDVVNHHAAQVDIQKSVSDPSADAKVNILGSLRLFEACRRQKVKKIIFASSGGAVYGEQVCFPADEGHPAKPLNPYGIAKLAVENYLQFYFRAHRIPFTILRYANVYGPRQRSDGEAGVIAIFTNKILRGEAPTIFGDGEQTRDYVYIDDVVSSNLETLRPEIQGIYNVGTGIETKLNDLARRLILLSGSNVNFQYAPARAGEQRRSSLKPGALQKTPPTSLESGLQSTIEWLRNHP